MPERAGRLQAHLGGAAVENAPDRGGRPKVIERRLDAREAVDAHDRLGEDLQEVAVLVAVGENAEAGELSDALADGGDARREVVVVRRGHGQELHAARPHSRDGVHDVAGGEGDVLDAGAAEVVEILRHLRLPAAGSRLVDGELDAARPVPSCMTFDIRAEYSVEIASSSKCRSSLNPIVSAKNRTQRFICPRSTLGST